MEVSTERCQNDPQGTNGVEPDRSGIGQRHYLNGKNRRHHKQKAHSCPVTHRATVFSTRYSTVLMPNDPPHRNTKRPTKLQNRHPGTASSRFVVKYQTASADFGPFTGRSKNSSPLFWGLDINLVDSCPNLEQSPRRPPTSPGNLFLGESLSTPAPRSGIFGNLSSGLEPSTIFHRFTSVLTLPMRKRRGFLRETHFGALYSQGVSQTPPIQSPEGLWLLAVMVRRILLTSGLDDAIHFTSPTIARDNRQRIHLSKGEHILSIYTRH